MKEYLGEGASFTKAASRSQRKSRNVGVNNSAESERTGMRGGNETMECGEE